MINELKLDLACGNSKRDGFKGIDVAKLDSVDYVVDLQQFPWPIESNSVEELHCSHYIEHIPHLNVESILKESNSFEEFKTKLLNTKDGFIDFINEIYRIMKPGGKVTIIAPYFSSRKAFGDPTHTRYISEFTSVYFSKDWRNENGLGHYGIECDFDCEISYVISNELTLKSEEVRNKSIMHDLNTVEDIIMELIKK